jgi:hypothetical protein
MAKTSSDLVVTVLTYKKPFYPIGGMGSLKYEMALNLTINHSSGFDIAVLSCKNTMSIFQRYCCV